jgi:hypothetical protein
VKQSLAYGLCAVVLANTAAAADTAVPFEGVMQPPMEPKRNADGTFRRIRNTIVTGYWSGYAVTASAPYASASATWQVPSVVYDGVPNPPYNEEAASHWVGIGGYGDSTLIQLGTAGTVFTDRTTSYAAWYELYPAGAVGLPNPVQPGDIIAASLQCTVDHGFRRVDHRGPLCRRRRAAPRLRSGDVQPGRGQRPEPEPVAGRQRHNHAKSVGGDIESLQPGQRQPLQHVLGGHRRPADTMYGRLLYRATAGDHRLAFRQPDQDQLGAILDPGLVVDQRLLLHRQQLHRLGDIRLSRRLPDRDDFLLGQLHRRWRLGTALATVTVGSVTPTSGGGNSNGNGRGSMNGHKRK